MRKKEALVLERQQQQMQVCACVRACVRAGRVLVEEAGTKRQASARVSGELRTEKLGISEYKCAVVACPFLQKDRMLLHRHVHWDEGSHWILQRSWNPCWEVKDRNATHRFSLLLVKRFARGSNVNCLTGSLPGLSQEKTSKTIYFSAVIYCLVRKDGWFCVPTLSSSLQSVKRRTTGWHLVPLKVPDSLAPLRNTDVTAATSLPHAVCPCSQRILCHASSSPRCALSSKSADAGLSAGLGQQ